MMSFAETSTVLAQAHLDADEAMPARTIKIVSYSDRPKFFLRVEVDGAIVGIKGQCLTTEMAVGDDELVRLLTGRKKGFVGVRWTLTSHGEFSLLTPYGIERTPEGDLVQRLHSVDISKRIYERIGQVALRQGSRSISRFIEKMLDEALVGLEHPNGVLTIHLDPETLDSCCDISEKTGTPIDSWIVGFLKENIPNFEKQTLDGECEN